jgi:hypothetical protein
MKNYIKKFLIYLIPEIVLFPLKNWLKRREIMNSWRKNGYSVPVPSIVKQRVIINYQKKYNCSTFIETGTYLGDTVEALKTKFKKVISIELGMDLYINAKERFLNDKNIEIFQGDSGKVLPQIVLGLKDPAIFWLDGHYSAGITAKGDKICPILEELDAIFDNSNLNHILLIDDARDFVGEGDYPTIERLTDYIKSKNERYKVQVKHDIIRYTI